MTTWKKKRVVNEKSTTQGRRTVKQLGPCVLHSGMALMDYCLSGRGLLRNSKWNVVIQDAGKFSASFLA
eukprot:1136464-Pelagomonas_calceolata.AAC.5